MDSRPRPCALIALALLAGATLAVSACSSGKPAQVVTVTVNPSSSSASGSPSPSSSTSSRAAPTSMTKLPGTCLDLLPAAAVDNALNNTLSGKTSFVVGTPDKTIGRVGYLNCRYGVRNNAMPAVEIGVSLYRTAAKAAARITATADDFGNHGASSAKVQVDGAAATILTGGRGVGYDSPTLVLATGQRTIAVSLGNALPLAGRTKNLTALARLALERTAR